jgi:conjugal transfer pilus assembly protein TraB
VSEDRRKQQWKALAIGGTALVGTLGILGWVMNQSQANLVGEAVVQSVDPTIISDAASSASPELSWVSQSRQEIERLTQQVGELSASVVAMQEQSSQAIAELTAQYDEAIVAQQTEINALKGMPTPVAETGTADPLLEQDFLSPPGTTTSSQPNATTGQAAGVASTGRSSFGQSFTLAASAPLNAAAAAGDPNGQQGTMPPGADDVTDGAASPAGAESRVRKLSSYVPAGSYAPATVIAGVDASAGVKSQENPVPVLLRLNGPVTTAAAGAGQGARINLTGCTVLGSAAADLSSERVYVRLTTMTCVNGRSEVLEVPVAGIVVGSGKAGVRGKVVTREGGLVRSAAVAGLLQGIGQTAANAAGEVTGSDTLDGTVSSITGASAAGAIGGGITGAANSLAEYYIERAEQYQPVVSLYAGTEVEVVFLDGVDLR